MNRGDNMPSRFEIATGQIPKPKKGHSKPKKDPQPSAPEYLRREDWPDARRLSAQDRSYVNFLSHIKLVNELNGEELRFVTSDFNISMGTAENQITQISLNLSCSTEDAQRFMSNTVR